MIDQLLVPVEEATVVAEALVAGATTFCPEAIDVGDAGDETMVAGVGIAGG